MNDGSEIIYQVKSGDTLYRLAERFGTTVEAIVRKNPTVNFRNVPIGTSLVIQTPSGNQFPGQMISKKDLHDVWRELWEQHVAWTRMDIISTASDNPDLNFTIERLLRNPTDMAKALTPFYGAEKANKFGDLIKEHLLIAQQLLLASKSGDKAAADAAEKKWYRNADEVAEFLHSINPYISADEFRKMFYEHLALTKEEAAARLNNEYNKDIALYDKIENEALMMADMISEGIIKQFPNEFY